MSNLKRDALYIELIQKIREFVEAGGEIIAWLQPGDDAPTHELIVAARGSEIVQFMADLKAEMGAAAFGMVLIAADQVGGSKVLERLEKVLERLENKTGEWDQEGKPWMRTKKAGADEEDEEDVS